MSRTIIVPVHDVTISSDYGSEFRIDRVTLISKDKIARLQSRFGISRSKWKLLKESFLDDRQERATTFGVVRDNSTREEDELVGLVEEELHILHLIQLPMSDKTILRAWSPYGSSLQRSQQHYLITDDGTVGSRGKFKSGAIFPLNLSPSQIRKDQLQLFGQMTKALRCSSFSSKWKRDFRRAMVLLGKSLTEASTEVAFLLACIGLETLLVCTESGQREQMRKAVFLFSGLNHASRGKPIEDQFNEAYDKRCRFVHRGESDDIQLADARIVQEILFNVIANIATHTEQFRSKQAVADVARQIAAARELGIENKYWPKKMLYRHCVTTTAKR
ncbi:hypothetical protein [Haloferula helveola]